MKHLGDITKIDGSKAPVVDCVIGGSPCQDLSVAGKRAGLDGERSGLFMEQIRIIKEMRENDKRVRGVAAPEFVRPRYMVWENVPGAFSSNKGEDFRVVLEETARVCQKDAVIPMPKDGKWRTSGCIVGNGWSIAWRVFDAQFWGVPQRRRRIALVADFGGESAAEILFVRKGVSGNSEKSREARKTASTNAQGGSGADDREGADIGRAVGIDVYNQAVTGDKSISLRTKADNEHQPVALIPYTLKIRSGVETDSNGKTAGKGALIQENLSATLGVSQDQYLFQPFVYPQVSEGVCGTLDAHYSNFPGERGGMERAMVCQAVCIGNHPADSRAVVYGISSYESNSMRSGNPNSGVYEADTSRTLDCNGGNPACNQGGMAVVYALDRASFNQGENAQFDFEISDKGINSSLVAKGPSAVAYGIAPTSYIVRRLTPLECERLQGFPSGWTDIGDWTDSKGKTKSSSDAARYKALGNSIALPSWKWVLKRLCACYERDATMASLFDGIGGFPYLWEMINGKGSCLWASEIEEFPIAVTKKRIGE